jgi:tetratricopeptide (TPR) repeat protein
VPESEAAREYALAAASDRAGREEEAISHYEAALSLGLDDDVLPGALLGYGSTLRNVGRVDESMRVLTGACERFPDDPALVIFRAFALASGGRCGEALADVVRLALARIDAPELKRYERAIAEYADELARRR